MRMRNGICFFFALCLISANVNAEILARNSFDKLTEPGWYPWGNISIASDPTAPDPPNVLVQLFPQGMPGGNSAGGFEYRFSPERQEIWFQYYLKYSSNWQWHPVSNKHFYLILGSSQSLGQTDMVVEGFQTLRTEHVGISQYNMYSNTGYNPIIKADQWYKYTIHAAINTPGINDGVFQVWVDDRLVFNYSNVGYRQAGSSLGFGSIKWDTVWGGVGDTVKQNMYIYVDGVIISTVPIGSKTPSPPLSLNIQ